MSEHCDTDRLFAEQLAAVVARIGSGSLENLKRLSGGASQEIWSFDIVDHGVDGGTITALILRREPEGDRELGYAAGLEIEAQVMMRAHDAGVLVPQVRLVLNAEDGLGSGFIMERIEGEALPPRILRNPDYLPARDRFAAQAGELLARIHQLDASGIILAESGLDTTLAAIEERYRDSGIARPMFDLALRWLYDNKPTQSRSCLVHGDFRNGNIMFGPEGVRAVLDWELTHIGDPMEDLGWVTVNSWRFGQRDKPVGGFGQLDDMLNAYTATSGMPVDRDAVHFWQVLGTLRWGGMCADMVKWVENGGNRTIERAVIARRASEAEMDLTDLLLGGLN